jgi:hypothetical protein
MRTSGNDADCETTDLGVEAPVADKAEVGHRVGVVVADTIRSAQPSGVDAAPRRGFRAERAVLRHASSEQECLFEAARHRSFAAGGRRICSGVEGMVVDCRRVHDDYRSEAVDHRSLLTAREASITLRARTSTLRDGSHSARTAVLGDHSPTAPRLLLICGG